MTHSLFRVRSRKHIKLGWKGSCAIGAAIAIAFLVGCNAYVLLAAGRHVHSAFSELSICHYGLLLGSDDPASIDRRTRLACRLLLQQKIKVIVISGHPDNQGVNEPAAMKEALEKQGAQSEAIRLDLAGRRTITSMRSYLENFGGAPVIVITDDYHIHRAVFLARRIGFVAHGIYPTESAPVAIRFQRMAREWFARCVAVYETL